MDIYADYKNYRKRVINGALNFIKFAKNEFNNGALTAEQYHVVLRMVAILVVDSMEFYRVRNNYQLVFKETEQ